MRNNSIQGHKEANDILKNYIKQKSQYMFIHYARQNCFENSYEKGPRVISIVVMNADSEQTMAFSLKKSAEKHGGDFFHVSKDEQDTIELEMLNSFFEYIRSNSSKKWFHWNMKNNNFGFVAIEERYKELGGQSIKIDEDKKINIAVLLKKKYGTNYAQNCKWNGGVAGKMYDTFLQNNIDEAEILNGEQEVKEYILQNIMAIEQSVQGKVKAFRIIIEKASDNVLKTRGRLLKDVYGLNISGIAQYIQDNAILALLFSIIGGVIATIISRMIGL